LPYVVLSCDNELHFFGLGVKALLKGLRHFDIVLGTVRVPWERAGPVWFRLLILPCVAAEAAKGHC